jgi:hypothetical protein
MLKNKYKDSDNKTEKSYAASKKENRQVIRIQQ